MLVGAFNSPLFADGNRDTDFSEYTLGQAPSDWTKMFTTSAFNATVVEKTGSLSGKALFWDKSSGGNSAFKWNSIPSCLDAEVLTRLLVPTSGTTNDHLLCPIIRSSGASGSENFYRGTHQFYFSYATVLYPSKAVNGSFSSLTGSSYLWPSGYGGNWVWQRFRVNGSSIKQKTWKYGDAEPVGWGFEKTDGSITSEGWVGLYSGVGTKDIYLDFFGVRTDGSTVPVP